MNHLIAVLLTAQDLWNIHTPNSHKSSYTLDVQYLTKFHIVTISNGTWVPVGRHSCCLLVKPFTHR